ncbi:MAG TPA: inosine/xanthosine triphosphatase [Candidatus Acidoferrales bacterium]|jgi:non-canonical (house-cleaning) NTP pyrophosphatase|nr:inosine/xanthosine triphosphatase [Candidatus Acidoferrales bacterium]
MQTIAVAVGSARHPKLNAVREALAALAPIVVPTVQFEICSVDAPSGVSHTPLSRAETMAGARQRVEAMISISRGKNEAWRYFVGLEGGLDVIQEGSIRWVFLENWAYVADVRGNVALGRSGGILLPDGLASEVVDRGAELGVAIDAFAGAHGIRDAQGAWGVLTHNLITRQDAFRTAAISAFARLFAVSPPEPLPSR